jgi:hypothetical protein
MRFQEGFHHNMAAIIYLTSKSPLTLQWIPIFKVRPVLSRRIYEDRVTMPVYGGGLYGECVTAGERMRSRSPLKTRFRIDHKSSIS